MATESVAKYVLEADEAKQIQWLLTGAIMAKTELEALKKNVRDAADSGMRVKDLTLDCFTPRPDDLDVYEAASMVKVLSVLPVVKEVAA